MKTTFFRSVVFKRAYSIVKETGCTFAAALTEAWARFREYRDKVVKEMAERINGFDHYYQRSDDNRVYVRWSNIEKEIRKELVALPKSFIGAITGQLKYQDNIKSFI